jgi:hypothetical protein
MNAIKIHKQIQSNDIYVDGLEKFIGRSAEIIILIDDPAKDDRRLGRDEAFKIIDFSTPFYHPARISCILY